MLFALQSTGKHILSRYKTSQVVPQGPYSLCSTAKLKCSSWRFYWCWYSWEVVKPPLPQLFIYTGCFHSLCKLLHVCYFIFIHCPVFNNLHSIDYEWIVFNTRHDKTGEKELLIVASYTSQRQQIHYLTKCVHSVEHNKQNIILYK